LAVQNIVLGRLLFFNQQSRGNHQSLWPGPYALCAMLSAICGTQRHALHILHERPGNRNSALAEKRAEESTMDAFCLSAACPAGREKGKNILFIL
jgi:hypothetical protein